MTSIIQGDDGGSYIPASQRPNGTWRKPRRVKDGYVPQEEVPLYQSKGKIWRESITAPKVPVVINAEVKKKKKKKKPTEGEVKPVVNPPQEQSQKDNNAFIKVTGKMKSLKIAEKQPVQEEQAVLSDAHKLRKLKKKLKEIETLEARIKSKELKSPDKEQLDKVKKKCDIEDEIESLEIILGNS